MICIILNFFLVLTIMNSVGVISTSEEIQMEWEKFKIRYNVRYKRDIEETQRYEIFSANYVKMEKHNLEYKKHKTTYKMGINQFSDKTDEELMKKPLIKLDDITENVKKPTLYSKFIPEIELKGNFDWRDHGYVTDVKNQGPCDSCWAFTATGALEGQHFASTGHLISLSEQNLMDCVYGISGCNVGGSVYIAYKWIKENGGINTECNYPYENAGNVCRFKRWGIASTVKEINYVTRNEKLIQQMVATLGPVSLTIYANPKFHRYTVGIFDDLECHNNTLNHGVLLVGYGTEKSEDYYIMKNSWGKEWGEEGYIRMKRDINQCEINRLGIVPIV